MAKSELWIGSAGWSYDDWNGLFYPAVRRAGFRPLAYLARFFNAVEVNASFYRIPAARTTAAWIRQVPTDFRFTFKLTNIFTHQRTEFPEPADVAAFASALRPLADVALLGPLLLQFPWSFRFDRAAVDWLARIADAFPDVERIIEVRHASWLAPDALECLRACGGFCNIDQPPLRDCIPPTAHVFGRSAYVRLHGRNAASWFADHVPAYERYNYYYDRVALQEWADRIRAMQQHAEQVFVFANNHYRAQAPANALELRALLERDVVAAPEELIRAYPRLAAVTMPPREPGLFDALD